MTNSSGTFEQFLLWERASRDALEVKRLYIDMAGDLVAGVVLSQIVYWHLPSRDGRPRLRVERQGELWLAKSRSEWWDECRISPKQADRALDVLREKGLIDVRLFKFGTAPTKHVRIRHEEFLLAWETILARAGAGSGPEGQGDFDLPQRAKSIFPKGQNRSSPKGKMHFARRAKSLDTEITTEITTAADGPPASIPDAAALLTEELVSQGVGRSAAERLAREKPRVCRRCLEYLPFAKVRSTKGAWLADAIRHEYGPPPGFEKAQARETHERERATRQKARQNRQDDRTREKETWLRQTLAEMEKAPDGRLRAFNEYIDRERERVKRVAVNLSPRRQQDLLADFDTPDERLRLLEQWLGRGEPVNGAPAPARAPYRA